MKLINWNTEWALPGSARGDRVAGQIADHCPNVACLTEAYPDLVSENGHVVTSSDDSGYANEGGRRKVVLWSREPWEDTSQGIEADLPGGRFISGVTSGIRFVGLCIPWKMAHVTTGRRDRKPWEDHLAYLHSLGEILSNFLTKPEPLVVVGDWNQRIPRTLQPVPVYEALRNAMPENLEIITQGLPHGLEKPLIDHIALCPRLSYSNFVTLPRRDPSDRPLSDHIGMALELSLSS